MSQIESTSKPRDVEEGIDRHFYRPIGYVLARMSHAFALSPNDVTIISIAIGIAAGHLFYYPDLQTNLVGMLLLAIAEAMDSADGQLARMTDARSRFGRILDGFATNLIFVSIYLHLCLRIIAAGGSAWIVVVALASGISHSFQCAIADYYRNAYLYFVYGEHRGEQDTSAGVQQLYRELTWRHHPLRKFLLRVYLNYTLQQELLTATFSRIYAEAGHVFGTNIPVDVQREYARRNRPLLKYYNVITANTRMIALCVSLLAGMPVLYLVFELVVLNAVLGYIAVRQHRLNLSMLETLRQMNRAGM